MEVAAAPHAMAVAALVSTPAKNLTCCNASPWHPPEFAACWLPLAARILPTCSAVELCGMHLPQTLSGNGAAMLAVADGNATGPEGINARAALP
mmetsp:Transcript_39058/g.74874  ORF Transcript_39058/g.74874 Transcript_39058/m.74874 type:complete len:94 (+) Transcript_39058:266-547(+)